MEWFILVLMSAVLISAYEIISKKVLKREHSTELLCATFIIAVVLQSFFIPWMNLQVTLSQLFLITMRAMLVATALLLFTRSMKHMEISSFAPMKNLAPVFLLFLSVIFLGEKANLIQILGIFLIIFGAYFLQIHDHYLDFFRHLKNFNNKYIYYAVVGAALFGVAAVISKIAVADIPPPTYIYFSNIIMALYFIITIYIHYDGWHDIKFGFKKTGWWVFPIAITFLLADLTYFTAVAMPAAMISLILPIRRMAALFTTIAGGRMFHDHYLFHKIASAVVMVFGAALIII